jgi:hypothetical protein
MSTGERRRKGREAVLALYKQKLFSGSVILPSSFTLETEMHGFHNAPYER